MFDVLANAHNFYAKCYCQVGDIRVVNATHFTTTFLLQCYIMIWNRLLFNGFQLYEHLCFNIIIIKCSVTISIKLSIFWLDWLKYLIFKKPCKPRIFTMTSTLNHCNPHFHFVNYIHQQQWRFGLKNYYWMFL